MPLPMHQYDQWSGGGGSSAWSPRPLSAYPSADPYNYMYGGGQQRFYQGPPTSRMSQPPGYPSQQGMAGNTRMGALGAAGGASMSAPRMGALGAAAGKDSRTNSAGGSGGAAPRMGALGAASGATYGTQAASAGNSLAQQARSAGQSLAQSAQTAQAAPQDDGIRRDSTGRHIVYNDGFWDYNDAGYKVDSVGNPVVPGSDDGINDRVERPIFGQMQKAGLIPDGVTWNMFKRGEWRPGMPGPTGATPANPAAPAATPSPVAAPAGPQGPTGSGYQYNYGQQPPPIQNMDPAWWQNPGNITALEYANNAANSMNNWNMDQFNMGWGVNMDQFAAGQSNAALLADYLTNLNNLDYNYYAAGLDADLGALGYMGDLYGGLNNSYNDMFGQMYYGDTQLMGNYLNSGANLANTYANTGLGYAGLTNDWDIAQMQELANWYNNQARNQTDLQVATMQAFGRDQAPNTRFMQNWG